MNRTQITTAAATVCAWCIPASGQPSNPNVEPGDAEADARALVDAVLGESVNDMLAAEHEELAAWAQTVIDRALNLGPAGSRPRVPGESMAPAEGRGFAGNGANTAEVLVFMSLAVPEPSWRQWSAQSARIGAPMVLRGVVEGGTRGDGARDSEPRAAGRRGDRSEALSAVPDRLGPRGSGGTGGRARVQQPGLLGGCRPATRSGDRQHRTGRGTRSHCPRRRAGPGDRAPASGGA